MWIIYAGIFEGKLALLNALEQHTDEGRLDVQGLPIDCLSPMRVESPVKANLKEEFNRELRLLISHTNNFAMRRI